MASERKEWAREHFRGFENLTMPSFTPDGNLDEEGVRLDVRKSVEHGFFSTFPVSAGLAPDEQRRFVETIVDEASGRILVTMPIFESGDEERFAAIRWAEQIGCEHIFLHYPREGLRADSEDELYRYLAKFIEATNLGVTLWATNEAAFEKFHPSTVPIDVVDRLADFPNVVALKVMATLDAGSTFELCERVGDRLLVGPVNFGLVPVLATHYPVQWSGAWTAEAIQSPENRYATECFRLFTEKKTRLAMELYFKILPAYRTLGAIMYPLLDRHIHAASVLKYYQWCVGGNGGLMVRDPQAPYDAPVTAAEMAPIRAAYRRMGVEVQAGDEGFFVGRAEAARTVRAPVGAVARTT